MFCMNCGKQVKDDAAFCPGCGAPTPQIQADATPDMSGGFAAQEVTPDMSGSFEAVQDFAFEMPGECPPIQDFTPEFEATQAMPFVDPASQVDPNFAPTVNPVGVTGSNAAAKAGAGAGTITLNKKGLTIGIAIICIALIAAAVCIALFVGAGQNKQDVGGNVSHETTVINVDPKFNPNQLTVVPEEQPSTPQQQPTPQPVVQKQPGSIFVSQVDNTDYPQIRLYVNFTDQSGNQISSMSSDYVVIREFDNSGTEYLGDVMELAPIAIGDAMNVNLVLDQSGSMNSSSKLPNAKKAAKAFISEITSTNGAMAEITSFDNKVFNRQSFTNERMLLENAVDSLKSGGETALYDALYWALNRTNTKSGSRVVIAFTDGQENDSRKSRSDVIELSKMTGIPVYIIGIGNDVKASDLESLAKSCNGAYYSAQTSNLSSVLEGIYREIYQIQRGMFRVVFKSNCPSISRDYRTFRISYSDIAPFEGQVEHTYVPEHIVFNPSDLSTDDYVLPDSSTRIYSKSELEQLSTWELYLARNEMFARYGRGFKNEDLVFYFNSKRWYSQRYTADEFDRSGITLNKTEEANAATMLEIEKARNSPYITQNRPK